LTGSGEALFVMLTLDCVGEATTVMAVAVLFAVFGSETVLVMFGELVIVVPGVVPELTLTTSGKLTRELEPTPSVSVEFSVHVKVPVPPAEMLLQLQPVGGVKESSVVLAGMVSVKVTVVEPEMVIAVGPLLVTDCV